MNAHRRGALFSRLLVVLGGALLIFALTVDVLGLGRPGIGRGQVLLAVVGLAALGLGLVTRTGRPRSLPRVRQRWAGLYGTAAVLLVNTVVLLVAVEAVGVWVISNPGFLPFLHVEERSQLPYYTSQAWAPRYWRELRAAERTRYSPYSLWHTAPFAGETLNVDGQGLRRSGAARSRDEAPRVLAFGGSTLWGYGSPDSHTIAAYLETGLSEALEREVVVENRGERGYVSTQSLIELVGQLQQGNVPDIVVFYDGFNDVAAAQHSGRAGSHLDQARIRTLLEKPLLAWLESTWTVGFASGLMRRGGLERPDAESTRRLAQTVTATYLTNHRLVSAMAREYGFESFFFWHPVLALSDKKLTPEEERLGIGAPALVELLQAVYPAMEEAALERDNLYYLAHVLDGEPGQVWIDEVHITPEGNERMARAMVEVMAERMGRE